LSIHKKMGMDRPAARPAMKPRVGNIVQALIERTFGWINRARRLAKDFEATIESALAWLLRAPIGTTHIFPAALSENTRPPAVQRIAHPCRPAAIALTSLALHRLLAFSSWFRQRREAEEGSVEPAAHTVLKPDVPGAKPRRKQSRKRELSKVDPRTVAGKRIIALKQLFASELIAA